MRPNPRETMRALPRFIQPLLTYVTGVPLDDEQPLYRATPWIRLMTSTAMTAAGVILGLIALSHPWIDERFVPDPFIALGLPALLAGWVMVCGGTRDLYVVVEHACTHRAFTRSARLNCIVGEAIATVLWVTTFEKFRADHMIHHQVTRTDKDPDVIFLITTAGFRRAMSRHEGLRWLIRTSLSPRFHFAYFWRERLKPNFMGRPVRVTASAAYMIALIAGLSLFDVWMTWSIVWAFPLIILFQIASLLNFVSEHRWLKQFDRGRLWYGRLNFGRFCGDPVPGHANSRLQSAWFWLVWWTRLLFIHLPTRVGIMVGDLPQHDAHHRRPGYDWCNPAFSRRDDVLKGCPGWPETYTERWGTVVDFFYESIGETYGEDWLPEDSPAAPALADQATPP
jgi:fatty acid desaturase